MATGVTATEGDEINCDDAESLGKAIQHHGVLYSEAKIKRDQIKTLEALEIGLRIYKEKLHVDPLLLFSSLLVLIEREEDIRSYFQYELTAVSTSVSEFDDAKIKESKTGTGFKEKCYILHLHIESIISCSLLHKVKWLKNHPYQSIWIITLHKVCEQKVWVNVYSF